VVSLKPTRRYLRSVLVALVAALPVVGFASPVSAASLPGAPSPQSVAVDGVAAIVRAAAPVSDGGAPITQYTFSLSDSSGSSPLICTALLPTCLFPDLSPSTTYRYTATATNAAGTGPASAPVVVVTGTGLPGVPRVQQASNTLGYIDGVMISPPVYAPLSTGGKPLTAIVVTLNPGGRTCNALASCQFAGLTPNTTYTYSAHAVNEIGSSPESAVFAVKTTSGLPGRPIAPSIIRTTATASVVRGFLYAYDNGGSPITSYTLTAQPGNVTCVHTSVTGECELVGLIPSTTYSVTATGTNVIGTGPASWATTFATTSGLPLTKADGATLITRTSARLGWIPTTTAIPTTVTFTVNPGGITCTVPYFNANGGACLVTGLSPSTSYTYSVVATNAAGSATSNVVAFKTGDGLPGITAVVSPKPISATSATARWNGATDGGYPITGYTATLTDPTGLIAPKSCTTAAGSCVFAGLNPSSVYTYSVQATNQWGTGPAGTATFTTLAAPTVTGPVKPTFRGATVIKPTSMTVGWSGAGNGGSPITNYTAIMTPSGHTCSGPTVVTCTATGLTPNTTYTWTITATNAIGTSIPTVYSQATSWSAPDTPVGLPAANYTAASADAVWSAPNDWGSPITMYAITLVDITPLDDLPRTCTTAPSARSCTFYNLVPSDTYSYTVRATNAFGSSVASAPITFTVPLV
jgi:hypothetical protein